MFALCHRKSLPFALCTYALRIAASLLAFALTLGLLARLAGAQTPDQSPRLRRYALIASSNDGGHGRAALRFANSDASAVSEVLVQLGGLQKQDLILLPNANRARVEGGFDRLRKALAQNPAPGARRELFVYYSGHSDEEGLLLGNERITYRELRQWIQDLGADVRIAVLDSCASGALIRLKGGAIRQPFLSDASTDARGHAFLTASSADESAQESDRVGAAFFTHYLVSGLRGAADASRDGRVTLGEAYQFAYNETLRRTEKSHAGAQHPAYDIQLAGTGDLVMTDLRSTDATLVLADKLVGHIFVRDQSGRLLVEMRKEPGYPVELGLGPGTYRVLMDADGRPFEANLTLERGARRALAQADFVGTHTFIATTRGSKLEAPTRYVPFDLVAAPGIRTSGRGDEPVRHGFVLGLLGHSDELTGVQLSLGGNIVERTMRGAQLATGLNLLRGYGEGAQLASGVNMAFAGFKGLQAGAVLNVSKGTLVGLQAATANWSQGDVRGVQAAVFNMNAGSVTGLQAGVININGGQVDGLQAGVVNISEGVEGAQIAVVNIGDSVAGSQIGVINVATKVSGFQLGVINVADSVGGASVGLLPLVAKGYHALAAWSSETSASNLGIKLGSQHVYTLFGGGLTNGPSDENQWSLHLALGVHLPAAQGRLFVDIDVMASQIGSRSDFGERASVLGALRAVVGYRVARHFALTLGPTYNVLTSWNGEDYDVGWSFARHVEREGEATIRMYPGFVLGFQI